LARETDHECASSTVRRVYRRRSSSNLGGYVSPYRHVYDLYGAVVLWLPSARCVVDHLGAARTLSEYLADIHLAPRVGPKGVPATWYQVPRYDSRSNCASGTG
jgi:hypothetical protein